MGPSALYRGTMMGLTLPAPSRGNAVWDQVTGTKWGWDQVPGFHGETHFTVYVRQHMPTGNTQQQSQLTQASVKLSQSQGKLESQGNASIKILRKFLRVKAILTFLMI